jgi:hypothetical protein
MGQEPTKAAGYANRPLKSLNNLATSKFNELHLSGYLNTGTITTKSRVIPKSKKKLTLP